MAVPSRILAWRIPMDRGAWRATVHGGHSQTQLKGVSSSIHLGHHRGPIKLPVLYSRFSLEYNFIFGDVCLATNLRDVQRLTISSGKSVQASLAHHHPCLAVQSRC